MNLRILEYAEDFRNAKGLMENKLTLEGELRGLETYKDSKIEIRSTSVSKDFNLSTLKHTELVETLDGWLRQTTVCADKYRSYVEVGVGYD